MLRVASHRPVAPSGALGALPARNCARAVCRRNTRGHGDVFGRRPKTAQALKRPSAPPTYETSRHTEQPNSSRVELEERGNEQVDWKRQWYPVMAIDDVDTKRPTAITILGKQLVVWQDNNGDCHVFEDRCPHRSVALSEGRIEGDALMCAYHGWKFDGAGTCTSIPQLFTQSDTTKSKILKSPAACAQAFPTAARGGLLWVWMSDSKHAYAEALQCAPPPCGALHATDCQDSGTSWYSRTVPMSWEVLLENITDPSHVPHSHHGIQGNRYKPGELEFVKTETDGVKGYRVFSTWTQSRFGNRKSRTVLCVDGMPSRASLRVQTPSNPEAPEAEWEGRDLVALHFMMAPVTRITSRLIFTVTNAFVRKDTWKGKLFSLLNPPWRDHLVRSSVLDGDAIFLHRQTIDIMNGKTSPQDYFLPARADRPVHALWAFLQKYAPNGVDLYENGQGEADVHHEYWPRERILDRYEQHVKHCKPCSRALRNTEVGLLAAAAIGAAAVANAARLVVFPHQLLSAQGIVSMLLAAAATYCWHKLQELRTAFGFSDYVHAEKD